MDNLVFWSRLITLATLVVVLLLFIVFFAINGQSASLLDTSENNYLTVAFLMSDKGMLFILRRLMECSF